MPSGPRGGTLVPSPDVPLGSPLGPDRAGGRVRGPAARARMARGWKRSRKAAARRAACSALSGRASACVRERSMWQVAGPNAPSHALKGGPRRGVNWDLKVGPLSLARAAPTFRSIITPRLPVLSLRHARGATGRRQRRGPLLAQRRRAVRLAAARRLRTGLRPLRPRDAARAARAPRRAGRQCRAESGARRVTDGAVTRTRGPQQRHASGSRGRKHFSLFSGLLSGCAIYI